MRWRWGIASLGTMTLAAAVAAAAVAAGRGGSAPAGAAVRLVLPRHALRAGEAVSVGIVDPASSPIIHTGCFTLQRREPRAWRTIDGTHGISLPCTTTGGVASRAAPARLEQTLVLYDDLRPGRYRITLLYRFLPRHWRSAGLNGRLRAARAELTVLRFSPGPAPRLPERRIRRIALRLAAGAGDARPLLIQHAQGPRFEANLISSPDLVWNWSWAYLIAMRGHFRRARSAPDSHSALPVITIVIDASTGRDEDLGTSDRYPDLARLGAVTTDYRR